MPRNDLAQYDLLCQEWWRPGGVFTMLHGLAAARARLVPPAARPGAVLVDLGCGAGLLAPHVEPKGYRHLGIDLVSSALAQAAAHGVDAIRADATRLPLADGCADVVSAGELFEHVADLGTAVREAARILRPGGLLVLDTLNDTALSRFVAVTVAERLNMAARGIHDPDLFVDRRRLVAEFARHGVDLRTRGFRPAIGGTLRWLTHRRQAGGRMVPTWSTAVLYQGKGVKRP